MFFPCGLRQPVGQEHWEAFKVYCGRNDLNPEYYTLHYWRPFNDGRGATMGFGIQSRLNGATDFVI